jgi:predicted TIM-barrel fold metal-dependent hydrolase
VRVVDCHVHLFPPEINRDPTAWAALHGEEHWATLCTRKRKNGRPVQTFPSVDELLSAMDLAGVERAVLLGWYWHRSENCAVQNRYFADCVRRHPDRLSAFATLQPAAGTEQMVDELRRAREEGLCGIGELSPHSQGYAIDEGAFRELLSYAAEWHWPVNLHVTDPNSRTYPGAVETPLSDFTRLAREVPQVNFVLAHWGGLLPLRDVAAAACPNLFYDTAASPLLYDESVWARFLAVVPPERILFGSDYPLNLYPKIDDAPTMVRFIDEARNARVPDSVFRENMLRLIGR